MDILEQYLRGLNDLLQTIVPTEADYLIMLTLQGRLVQVISDIRQFGPTDNTRAEIARVTTELDRLCLTHLGKSFRNLCDVDDLSGTAFPFSGDGNIVQVKNGGSVETGELSQKSEGCGASNLLIVGGEVRATSIKQEAKD